MSEATKNLLQRMNAVRKEVDYIQKKKAVEGYKAVTHDQVTGMLREHLIANGIATVVRLVESSTVDTGTKTSKGTPIVRFEGVYDIDFVNIDEPTQRETFRVPAHANDHGDKAPGKATSYAVKGAFLKGFNIETGEDEESRYGSDDPLTAEELAAFINQIAGATSMDQLRGLYEKAAVAADQDVKALDAIVKAKDKRKAELGTVTQPRAKGESEPAATQPAAPDEPKATPALLKMLRSTMDKKHMDIEQRAEICSGVPMEDLTKSQAAAILKKVEAL